MEEAGYAVIGGGRSHACDLLSEDGEEHCDGEGEKNAGGEVAEFGVECEETDDFARRGGCGGGRGGRALIGGWRTRRRCCWCGVWVPAEEQHEGEEGGDCDGGGGQKVGEGRLATLLRHHRGAVAAVGVGGRRGGD